MKKILTVMILALVFSSCQKKVNIGTLTLGEDRDKVMEILAREEMSIYDELITKAINNQIHDTDGK